MRNLLLCGWEQFLIFSRFFPWPILCFKAFFLRTFLLFNLFWIYFIVGLVQWKIFENIRIFALQLKFIIITILCSWTVPKFYLILQSQKANFKFGFESIYNKHLSKMNIFLIKPLFNVTFCFELITNSFRYLKKEKFLIYALVLSNFLTFKNVRKIDYDVISLIVYVTQKRSNRYVFRAFVQVVFFEIPNSINHTKFI